MVFINVLTYNISWATQANKVLGSEADFVKACQKKYKLGGVQCINNAINNLSKLPSLDLIGLQEVNSEIEKKIMKVQSNLKKFIMATEGLSSVSILWNPNILGILQYKTSFNLVKNDDRPCLIILLYNNKTDNYFLIINVHMPWGDKFKEAIKNINKNINNDKIIMDAINKNKDIKIIMTGDFNDSSTKISKYSPLILKSKNKTIKLRYNKTKKEANKTLKSCCWHEAGHKYKHFSDTGDYILVNKNIKQINIKIPEIFKKRGRENRLFSDHMPVFSKLFI